MRARRELPPEPFSLNRSLEDWIARDPSLVVEGLKVVGKQITLEGGRLDLLGVDPQGLWTVVEIKRGLLYRDTVAQALDYASSVARCRCRGSERSFRGMAEARQRA